MEARHGTVASHCHEFLNWSSCAPDGARTGSAKRTTRFRPATCTLSARVNRTPIHARRRRDADRQPVFLPEILDPVPLAGASLSGSPGCSTSSRCFARRQIRASVNLRGAPAYQWRPSWMRCCTADGACVRPRMVMTSMFCTCWCGLAVRTNGRSGTDGTELEFTRRHAVVWRQFAISRLIMPSRSRSPRSPSTPPSAQPAGPSVQGTYAAQSPGLPPRVSG